MLCNISEENIVCHLVIYSIIKIAHGPANQSLSLPKLITIWASFITEKVCVKPSFPAEMTMSPLKNEYRVGESFGVVCAGHGQSPSGSRYYTCTAGLAWEPQVPEDIQCQEGRLMRYGFCILRQTLTEKEVSCMTVLFTHVL